MARALVLVDGDHYPRVIRDACRVLAGRGEEIAAAVFLGGGEKLGGRLRLEGIPVVEGATQVAALEEAIRRFHPDVVWDLSDAPVVDSRARGVLAAVALARGVAYAGAGVRMEPPRRPRVSGAPSIAVIGTGKRAGKTAMACWIARRIAGGGHRVVVVAMGRGGPAEPVVVRGDLARPTVEDLMAVAERGGHAASDCYEDALCAGVATVGAWRAGAGPAGAPVADNVAAAVEAAGALAPDLVVLDGSGTAIPPVAADATVLVVGAGTPPEEICSGSGPYRLLLADLVVATMAGQSARLVETPPALVSAIHEFARDVPLVRTVLRPRPLGSVTGRKVFFCTTAPESALDLLRIHLEEEHGARVVGMTHRLADRAGLVGDLAAAAGRYEVLLTELKAAAMDVAAAAARGAGAEVVFAENEPRAVEGDLEAGCDGVEALARKRFAPGE